jgi:hypothetical protein
MPLARRAVRRLDDRQAGIARIGAIGRIMREANIKPE